MVERGEVSPPHGTDLRVGHGGQQSSAQQIVLQHSWYLEDGVLAVTAPGRIGDHQAFICFDQEDERHAKHQLHARPPVVVELVLEDSQGVLDELVAAPTESYVQEIQAKRPTGGAPHVEMYHLRL